MTIKATRGYKQVKRCAVNFVQAMKVGERPGIYRKEEGEDPGLYGSYHGLHILDIFGKLEDFAAQEIDTWAEFFHRRQCEQGYYSNNPGDLTVRRGMHDLNTVWHSTRGILWSLRILDRKPLRELAFLEPFLKPTSLYEWVKWYDWSNPWAASNQILACATALMALRDWFDFPAVDELLEQGMYPALEELLDEETGYWGTQLGADLASGMFGTIHVLPIYFAQGWPFQAVERAIDSTLAYQLADGSFWPGGSDCPDFDGAYMLANLSELADYRHEDLLGAARCYLQHALMHQDLDEMGWLLHRRDSKPGDWKSRPHFIWREGSTKVSVEWRDEDPTRKRIMLGSWFYPLSIALIARMLGDTGYEGPYRLNRMSLHQCNVFEYEDENGD